MRNNWQLHAAAICLAAAGPIALGSGVAAQNATPSDEATVSRLPETPGCIAFREAEWPSIKEADKQYERIYGELPNRRYEGYTIVEMMQSVLSEKSESEHCKEKNWIDRDEIKRSWSLDTPVGSERGRSRETWWYHGRLCMAEMCEEASARREVRTRPPAKKDDPPMRADPRPPEPEPPRLPERPASTVAPQQRQIEVPKPPPPSPWRIRPVFGAFIFECTVVITAAMRTTKGQFDQEYMTRNPLWPIVGRFYQSGLQMGFLGHSERGGDREQWTRVLARDDAHSIAMEQYVYAREVIRQAFYPEMELEPPKSYFVCKNKKTGESNVGTTGRPPPYERVTLQ